MSVFGARIWIISGAGFEEKTQILFMIVRVALTEIILSLMWVLKF